MLIAINHGFAGGPSAERLSEQLQAAIRGSSPASRGRRWRESQGGKKPPARRPVQT